MPRRDLHALAARLGSDVPFALHGGTALGTGRGEELATVLTRETFHWVLAFADRGLSTPAVFAELDRLRDTGRRLPESGDPEPVLAALAAGDPQRLAGLLGNDLQAAAISLNPALRRTLRAGGGRRAGRCGVRFRADVCVPVRVGGVGGRRRRGAVGVGRGAGGTGGQRPGLRGPVVPSSVNGA